MIEALRSRFGHGAGPLVVTGLLVAVVLSMVVPLPARALDIGIALSIATATMVLVMASLTDKPTDFQAFPVLLLVTLLIRLSLNISSTRLILTQGQTGELAAGQVIYGFSNFVAGGSVLVGLTIFAVISAVNFIVITKGAGRMAEVSARFALDSLPGKQLAIDGDLNSGAITHDEAKARRAREQEEISFYGSLDGASKFVKGDAIAGIVVTLINLVVGIAVGVVSHNLAVSEAIGIYSRLTIGDGLVSQIPALITSLAAALLLSRGGATKPTADMLLGETITKWQTPAVVSAAMLLMMLVPGMPKPVFLAIALVAAGLAAYVRRRPEPAPEPVAEPASLPPRRIGDELDMDDISVEIGSNLVLAALDPGRGLAGRIDNLRIHVARSYGLILPEIRVTDDTSCDADAYAIRVHGVMRGRGALQPHKVLALGDEAVLETLNGTEVREPVFGTPARWIVADSQEQAQTAGATVVTPIEILSTHLMEVVKANLSSLLTMSALQKLLAELKTVSDQGRAQTHAKFLDSMIPERVSPELLLSVLREMLDEDLSIRNLPLIVDAINEVKGAGSPELVAEAVRKRLRGQITERVADTEGCVHVLQLHPAWEAEFTANETGGIQANNVAVANDLARRLASKTRLALSACETPGGAVLAAPDHRRRQIRDILTARGVCLPVLALGDIDPAAEIRLAGTIEAAA
ncbi:MAG: FHIPEP family type III secretion protein [Paracoccus sp. (in: a-proteobacteria)]|nr:FHIPEP family type III secretion protein [Paracoccus sp. (in: a-proteobacteria)]